MADQISESLAVGTASMPFQLHCFMSSLKGNWKTVTKKTKHRLQQFTRNTLTAKLLTARLLKFVLWRQEEPCVCIQLGMARSDCQSNLGLLSSRNENLYSLFFTMHIVDKAAAIISRVQCGSPKCHKFVWKRFCAPLGGQQRPCTMRLSTQVGLA